MSPGSHAIALGSSRVIYDRSNRSDAGARTYTIIRPARSVSVAVVGIRGGATSELSDLEGAKHLTTKMGTRGGPKAIQQIVDDLYASGCRCAGSSLGHD